VPGFNRSGKELRGPPPVALNPGELHSPDAPLQGVRPVRR
jgi:hypothetical protein